MKQMGVEEEKDETDDAEAEKLLESEDLKELIQKEEEE